ncbi:MAG: type VI secretion system tip protein VgrG [Myxococcales bacterium]|nr:type VI secretion system tip protein VgrG [Myxococcales bacterium]
MSQEPFELSLVGYYPDSLRVLWFRGREAVNALYHFDLCVACQPGPEVPLESAALERPVSLVIRGANAARAVHGIVAATSLEGAGVRGEHIHMLRLVPRLWLAKRRRACRIFQDMSAVEIVESLFAERGVASRRRLQAEYEKRPYSVQYQESDYAFIRRILAEEGIFFSFDHPTELGGDTNMTGRGATEVVVLGDSADWCPPLDGGEDLVVRPAHAAGGLVAAVVNDASVERFSVRRTIRSRVVHVRRYDFRRPGIPLTASAETGARTDVGPSGVPSRAASRPDAALQTQAVFDEERDLEEARRAPVAASVMLEQLRARVAVGAGESSCPRLMPGRRFVLRDADPPALSGPYLCASVDHDGVAPAAQREARPVYHNRFECVPADVRLRPPRPRRRLHQVMETATVVGPPGEEIHTDAVGRVKVQFHWDRQGGMNDRSSCWLRVAQIWAGTRWGAQFVPRVGMEVLVTFLGGDADRPLVTGTVYNMTHPPPYPLPDQKTRSGIRTQTTPGGGGSNELAFEDGKGRELVYLHAQRDLEEVVDHDHASRVGNDAVQTVGGSLRRDVAGDVVERAARSRTVLVGDDLEEKIGGDRHFAVYGLDHDSVTQNRTSTIRGQYMLAASGGMRTVVGTKEKPQSAESFAWQNQVLGAQKRIRLQAEESITLVCGTTVLELTPKQVTIRSERLSGVGTAEIALQGNGPALTLGTEAEMIGKKIRFIAEKSSLELADDAQLDGTNVKLNCKGIDASVTSDGEEPKTKSLKLRVTDANFEPLASKDWVLVAGGAKFEGTTDGDGNLVVDVPEDAESANLSVWVGQRPEGKRLRYSLTLAALPEVGTVKGAQVRLRNLGYYWGGDAKGEELDAETKVALAEFQRDHDLEPTGALDEGTQAALTRRAKR